MKTDLPLVFSFSLLLLAPWLHAQEVEHGSPAVPTDRSRGSADALPEGLSQGDWSSIRAAYEAWRHAAVACDGGWRNHNPGQGWTTVYDDRGATTTPVSGEGWTWGLELASYGFEGGSIDVERAASVSADGGRVSLAWDAQLTEWWVNDTRGLEHGFTVHSRPEGAEKGGALRFTLDVRGGLRPEVDPSRRGARFVDDGGGAALTYAGLVAFDACGRVLEAWMDAVGDQLVLCIDELGAQYPLTVDPVVQAAYVKASNTDGGDLFGYSVAASGDTVVVAAVREDSNGTGVNGPAQADNSASEAGAAYVFIRSGATWSQQAYLKASNTDAGDDFSWSVAISGDTVVVGARLEDSNGTGVNGPGQANNGATNSGAAHVFTRSGTTWSQQAYLKASNTGSGDQFGFSVAVSGDTVVVGAPLEGSNGTGVNGPAQADNSAIEAGAAYVFTRNSGTWSQEAYLKASNTGMSDNFGYSVAASGDTVVVGAVREDSNGTGVNGPAQADNSASGAGAAYVFTRSGTTWSQQAYLKASNTDANDNFGFSVAASGDTVVIGAHREGSNGTGVNGPAQADNSVPGAGASYVFARSGTAWSQQAYLKASNTGLNDQFGSSVAVYGDTAVVGAIGERSNGTGVNGPAQANDSAISAGAAYVFTRSGTTWNQQAYLKASNTGGGDQFGSSVAVDGDTVVVGSQGEDSNDTGVNGPAQANNSASDSGAAYIFDLIAPGTIGTNFCHPFVQNSSGTDAVITATGSTDVSLDDVTLTITGLPLAGTTALLVNSMSASQTILNPSSGGMAGVPSAGRICIGGGNFGRHIQDIYIGNAGTFAVPLDLDALPYPEAPGDYSIVVLPGTSWFWQCWYRDGNMGQSNFSDAVRITFE